MPDTQTERAHVIIRRPQDGEQLDILGNAVQVKLTGADTVNIFSLALYAAAPHGGPPPHRHRTGDELFIVIDDGLEFFDGTAWHTATAGTVVLVPVHVTHTFRNASGVPARTWVMSAPAGFDRFMRDFAALIAKTPGGMPAPEKVSALYDTHGVETV